MNDLPPMKASRDDAARLLRGAARKHAIVVRDLFLPEELRLNERERLTARALLDRLIRTVEDEVRTELATRFTAQEALHAALASAHVEIAAPRLQSSRLLRNGDLVGLLLRRVEEHRLFLAARQPAAQLFALVADRDPQVATDAMAVLVARNRRLDRFQDPALARTELPAELQHELVWTVAAALRTYLIETHGVDAAAADHLLGAAARRSMAVHDEGDGLEARCARLARRLHGTDRLDSETIVAFLAEGTLPLFLAGLSAAAGISASAAWDILADPIGRGPVFLLGAAGLDRAQAARALMLLAAEPDDDLLIEQIALFDTFGRDEAVQALSLWALDPAYRNAVLLLSDCEAVA
jgi:uncharacterized protein (DUF2336 family)